MINISLTLNQKPGENYYVTARVQEWEMGVFVANHATLQGVVEDTQRQLTQALKERCVGSKEKILISAPAEIVGLMGDLSKR